MIILAAAAAGEWRLKSFCVVKTYMRHERNRLKMKIIKLVAFLHCCNIYISSHEVLRTLG